MNRALLLASLFLLQACGQQEPVVPDGALPPGVSATASAGEKKGEENKPIAVKPGDEKKEDEKKDEDKKEEEEPVDPLTPPPPPKNPALNEQGVVISSLEKANQIRRENNIPELQLDEKMAAVAQKHAEDMVTRRFLNHINPDGLDPMQRMKNGGVEFKLGNENIVQAKDLEEAFQTWLGSAPHKKQLLNKAYKRHGIGYADGHWVHLLAD